VAGPEAIMELKGYGMTTSCKNAFKFKTGEVICNKWVIREIIDKGGMGENYRAHQTSLNRDVAIKVISHGGFGSIDGGDDEIEPLVQRHKSEVQAVAQMSHPNVVKIFDHDSISIFKGDRYVPVEFIVMEYISGGSLRATMPEGGLYPEESAAKTWIRNYFMPILEGVETLHNHDVAHRDLKPENILIDHDAPKIAYYGLSLSSRREPVMQSKNLIASSYDSVQEQHVRKADQCVDVYSLGKILFEAIDGKIESGTTPIESVNLAQSESSFFQELIRIIQMAMAESGNERIESVQELRNQLKRLNNPDKHEQTARSNNTKPASLFSHSMATWSILVVAALSVALLIFWYFKWNHPLTSMKSISIGSNSYELPSKAGRGVIVGTPGRADIEHREKQRFISGGEFLLPVTVTRGERATIQVESFYMDEFLVTNEQFVEFLNQNITRISIESGVVKGDGANWLFLGEVRAEYEPIIYRNGKFHISDPAYAFSPVLRVTSFGASAFAMSSGGRLPTEVELFYVITKGMVRPQSGTEVSSPVNATEQFIDGVTDGNSEKLLTRKTADVNVALDTDDFFRPNSLGIKGLNGEIGEWVFKIANDRAVDHEKINRYAVVGGQEGAPKKGYSLPSLVNRIPWEGCEDVGFRTVRNAAQ